MIEFLKKYIYDFFILKIRAYTENIVGCQTALFKNLINTNHPLVSSDTRMSVAFDKVICLGKCNGSC